MIDKLEIASVNWAEEYMTRNGRRFHNMLRDAFIAGFKKCAELQKSSAEWKMFDLITSAYYGKMMYSKQDNGIIYSRYSDKYMRMDEAINEFLALIGGDLG